MAYGLAFPAQNRRLDLYKSWAAIPLRCGHFFLSRAKSYFLFKSLYFYHKNSDMGILHIVWQFLFITRVN